MIDQVIFIDSRVPDLAALLAGLAPGEQAFVLDPTKDGVQQIADLIAGNHLANLSAISIVGHGVESAVQLGSNFLDESDLATQAGTLAAIGASLAPGGDFQLYACDVASGADGHRFIADLSVALGNADVAASTHLVGAASLGGSWILDAATGSIEADIPFTAETQEAYQGVLAVTFGNGPQADPIGDIHTAGTAEGRLVFGDFDNDGDIDILYQDSNTAGAGFGYMRNNGSGAFTDLTDANAAGTPFDTFDFTGQQFTSLFVVDYDNDGDTDIIDRDLTGGGLGAWRNDNGVFSLQADPIGDIHTAGAAEGRMVFGDFDSDGDLDIPYQDGATAGAGFGYMQNNGSGGFTDFTDANAAGSPFDTFVFTGQQLINLGTFVVDNDGDTDIIDRDFAGGGLGAWRNDNGVFSLQADPIGQINGGLGEGRMVFGDFDSDGDIDILYQAGAVAGAGFGYKQNNGSGSFTNFSDANAAGTPFDTFDFTGQQLLNQFAVDYDHDGDLDIVDRDVAGGLGVWQQGSTAGDGHPPHIASTNPADNSTTVSVGANLVVTFTESVSKGTGDIVIVRVSDGSVVETIAVTGGQVTGSGTTWTINPSVTLVGNVHYAVHFDAGTFVDGDGAIFAGVSDDTTYDFTTRVNQPPSGADNTIATPEGTAHVFAASDFGFTDVDGNSLIAVKITTVPLAGTLTNNGVTVTAGQFVSIADINANKLVFTPAANANRLGYASFTFQVQDDGGTGVDTDASANTLTLNVTAVNDAPAVSGDGTESLAATNEDVADVALTNTVSALLGGQYSDSTDQVSGGSSADAFAGMAVVVNGSSAGTGQWQYYNGSTWVNIGAASTAAAVQVAASAPLRFLPAADYNGPAPTLTVKLVDASGGAFTNGAVVNVTTSGGSTPYSVGTVVLGHSVTAVNDAPVTTGGAAVALTTIAEDSAPGAGQTVSSLFATHFSDAKDQVTGGSSANAFTGIAVTSNTATAAEGVYQYFAAGAWHDLPAVSTGNAFVLDASTLVRFVPAADFSGTPPSLIVNMIEDSSGAVTTGATADLTTTGGPTPYGTAMTLGIAVSPTNDAPVPSGAATLAAVNEDTAAPGGQAVSTLFGSHFSDPDVGDTLAGVAITGNAATSQGVWQYFSGAWITIGVPGESTALVLSAGTLVRFRPAADFNGTVPALTATLIDSSGGAVTTGALLDVSVNGGQTRFSDTGIDLTTSITAVNDTPVVPASATAVGATEQIAAILLGSLTVADVDLDARNGGNGDYGGASFTVQRASANAEDSFDFAAGGLFTVSGANLQVGGLTFATFTSTGGVLTISFTSAAATATTALVNDVIEHIAYTNSSDAPPAAVSLNYTLNDGAPGAGQGTGGEATSGGSVTVNITAQNDAPTGGAGVSGTAAEDQVLTAVSTLADVDGLGTLHYQWQHDVGSGYVDVGSDQSTYTLGDGDIGGVVRVVISYTDAGGAPESSTSSATATVTATNDAPTGGVSVAGTTTEDQVLTADTSALTDSDGLGPLHFDWQRNTGSGFASIGAADQATYTLGDADVASLIRVVVGYTDGQGFANNVSSAGTAAISAINDPHTGDASISGTATEDQVLTAVSTLADVDGLGTLHYQWQHDVGSGYVDVGSDQSTYTPGDADVGGVVRVVISYTDGQGFAESSTSAGTAAIAGVNDDPTGGVSISGTTTEDQVLTADTSTLIDPDGLGTLHYRWQRDSGSGYVDVGTDQSTYTLGDADVGGLIRVLVEYVDQQGTTEALTSAATAAIAGLNDPHTGVVSITGAPVEDQVLTVDTSTLADVDGLGTLLYQWQLDDGSGYVDVGTDQSTYTLGDADVGGIVRVLVGYTDGQGFLEASTSVPTAVIANVNDSPTGGVSVTGTTTENQVLTADTSTLADADGLGTLHYQWQRDSGSGYVVVGSDQATYTLGDADVGGVIRVVAAYVDQHGTAEVVTSVATAAIAGVNDPHTGVVSVAGTPTEDQVLTADTSSLADVDGVGTLHYRWQHDLGSGYVDVGTDQATYTLGDADVGGTVRVIVSYTDGQGFAEGSTGAPTAAIANVNDSPTGGVSVTGTTTEDAVLTADTSTLADADGLGTLHYQWQRDSGSGYVGVGTDQSTYTLGDVDVGAVIRVVTAYVDQRGTAETVISAGTAAIAPANDPHTGGASLAGTPTEDQVLTAASTMADVDGLGALHYQWQHDFGSGYVNVGTDQSTYTLGDADVGGKVRVVVGYTDGQGFAESAASAATATVAAVSDPHTGSVSIAGTATEDRLLTADTSTLADPDGLGALHYQWQRNHGSGFVDVGTDQATYRLGDADVGATVRTVVSYTDAQGFAESSTSAATAAVAGVNDAPSAVVLSNVHAPFPENTSTAARIKVADIAVTDVDGGTNNLSLSGADANLFQIIGSTLWLKAGARLDYEANPFLNVNVKVDDATVGGPVDATKALAIAVTDIAENIIGTPRNDRLIGTNNGETIKGLAGNDIIFGLGGNDRIIGGPGADRMTGGLGKDVFVFNSISDSAPGQSGYINNGSFNWASGQGRRDVITDFTHGQDKIDLSAIDANSRVGGNQAFTFDGQGRLDDHHPGELVYRQFNFSGTANDKTIIYCDVNGDARADFQVELTGLKLLAASDFVL